MKAEAIKVEIPFRTAFSHARARRKASSAIVVRLRDNDGRCGYGEGCPRDYVTGETLESAQAWLKARIGPWSRDVTSLDDLQQLCDANEDAIDQNPSAFCAFELAILDLLARRAGMSIETYLGLEDLNHRQMVTAVSGSDDPLTFHLQALRFRMAGMTAAKLKVTGDMARNRHRVRLLARFATVRLDGNNLWSDAGAAIAALRLLKDRVWAIEEPVQARDFAAMMRIHNETGLKIILDESLLNRRDLDALLSLQPDLAGFVVNMRVSKMGGLLRSLSLAKRLRAFGVDLIVGSQVGETSCLARAALVLAQATGPLLGFEAGYGCHLLTRDGFKPSLTFDHKGVLARGDFQLDPLGLGLRPSGLAFSDGTGPK